MKHYIYKIVRTSRHESCWSLEKQCNVLWNREKDSKTVQNYLKITPIAKRVNDVMTETNFRQTNQMGDDFPKTLSKTASVPKTHFWN